MRKRISDYKNLKAGDIYRGVLVKVTQTLTGAQCPIRAFYDNGEYVKTTDKVLRIVLNNGFIHYIKL